MQLYINQAFFFIITKKNILVFWYNYSLQKYKVKNSWSNILKINWCIEYTLLIKGIEPQWNNKNKKSELTLCILKTLTGILGN